MTRMLSLVVLSSMMALSVAGSASADERRENGMRHGMREQCTIVKRCHSHDGRLRCEREKVCKMVRGGRDWDRR